MFFGGSEFFGVSGTIVPSCRPSPFPAFKTSGHLYPLSIFAACSYSGAGQIAIGTIDPMPRFLPTYTSGKDANREQTNDLYRLVNISVVSKVYRRDNLVKCPEERFGRRRCISRHEGKRRQRDCGCRREMPARCEQFARSSGHLRRCHRSFNCQKPLYDALAGRRTGLYLRGNLASLDLARHRLGAT